MTGSDGQLEQRASLVKGILFMAVAYFAMKGVAVAFEAGRLQQPEVSYLMGAVAIGMVIGIREIALSPWVVRTGVWIRRSVMNHV